VRGRNTGFGIAAGRGAGTIVARMKAVAPAGAAGRCAASQTSRKAACSASIASAGSRRPRAIGMCISRGNQGT
jgi:hypothetical protein